MITLVVAARKLLILVAGMAIMSSCSQVEPSGGLKKVDAQIAAVETEKTATTASKQATYDSFKITVFPILEKNCGGCHGSTAAPKFAQEDHVSSHDALVDAGKVDFDDASQSRVVLRLNTDRHNCWGDCEANGAELQSAIENWVLSRTESTTKKKIIGVSTAEIALSKITSTKVASPADIGMIAFEAESGVLAGGYASASDANASDGFLVSSETDAGVAAGDLAAAHIANANLGSMTFNIIASEAGFYQLFAYARRATGNPNNDFFVKIDDGDMLTWNIGSDTNINEFQSNEDPGEFYLDWEKGAHTVTIYQAALGASLDKVIITKNIVPDFTQVETNPLNYDSLLFDLSDILKIEASFSLNLIKTSDGVYTVQNPTLFNPTGANIKLRGIYPLISGEFTEQNAIYKDLDILTNKEVDVLSTGSSIFLLGKGEEGEDPLLSIKFNILEISAEDPTAE